MKSPRADNLQLFDHGAGKLFLLILPQKASRRSVRLLGSNCSALVVVTNHRRSVRNIWIRRRIDTHREGKSNEMTLKSDYLFISVLEIVLQLEWGGSLVDF